MSWLLAIQAENQKLYRGVGCKTCNGSGYAGRVGIFEVLMANKKLRDMIAADAQEQDLTKAVVGAGITLMQINGIKRWRRALPPLKNLTG